MNITPQKVVLTSGQGATFEARNSEGQPIAVNWSFNPAIGTLVPPPTNPPTPTRSVTYIGLPLVSTATTIVLVASTADESASATIDLTPDAITVFPPKVDLKPGQSQQFVAHVAGAPVAPPAANPPGQVPPPPTPSSGVTWVLSPEVGTLDKNSGKYTAPDPFKDSTAVAVTAITNGRANAATVNLVPPPWTGRQVNFLGGYLLIVFLLVFLLIGFWPAALPTPEVAKAARLESEKTLKNDTDTLKTAETVAKSEDDLAAQAKSAAAGAPNDAVKAQAASAAAAKAKIDNDALSNLQDEKKRATEDLDQKWNIEREANDSAVKIGLREKKIGREVDLILLVLLAGALGSFLHAARSYADFRGNQTIKSSWVWWYCMAPFTGSILALVFFAAVRGGFLALNAGANNKASDFNPYGVAAMAAIVGMFSKDATTKLGELFKSLFNTEKAKEAKDPLKENSPTPATGANAAAAASGSAAGAGTGGTSPTK